MLLCLVFESSLVHGMNGFAEIFKNLVGCSTKNDTMKYF